MAAYIVWENRFRSVWDEANTKYSYITNPVLILNREYIRICSYIGQVVHQSRLLALPFYLSGTRICFSLHRILFIHICVFIRYLGACSLKDVDFLFTLFPFIYFIEYVSFSYCFCDSISKVVLVEFGLFNKVNILRVYCVMLELILKNCSFSKIYLLQELCFHICM